MKPERSLTTSSIHPDEALYRMITHTADDPVNTTQIIADIDGVTFDPRMMYANYNELEYFIYDAQNADDPVKATACLLSEIIPESAKNNIAIIVKSNSITSLYDVSARANISR